MKAARKMTHKKELSLQDRLLYLQKADRVGVEALGLAQAMTIAGTVARVRLEQAFLKGWRGERRAKAEGQDPQLTRNMKDEAIIDIKQAMRQLQLSNGQQHQENLEQAEGWLSRLDHKKDATL